jgi:hypothetical protein
MKKRIIIDAQFGRLGNTLYRFCNLLAFAIENDFTVWDSSLHVSGYSQLFPNIGNRLFLSYPGNLVLPFRIRIFHPVQSILIRFIAKKGSVPVYLNMDMEKEVVLDKHSLFPSPIKNSVVVRGFHYYANEAVAKHANYLRWLFTPAGNVVSTAKEDFAQISSVSDLVIGVHIRHGDYKTWKDGRYFFETAYYAEVMGRILGLFPRRKIRFMLFTDNENLETKAFDSFNWTFPEVKISDSYDLCLMSLCDYLVAPLYSTFSGWASFFGETPLYRLNGRDLPQSVSDFIYEPVLNNSRNFNRSWDTG